jgi:hypothetical protein
VHQRIGLNGRGAVDVLDEQDFVADLVIEKLVDGASGEDKTEAAGWQALFPASADVGDEVVGGFGDRFFSEIGDETFGWMSDAIGTKWFVVEAGARVADVEHEGPAGADGSDLDHLLGIEGGAVLHGVEKDLAEADEDVRGACPR